MKVKHLTLATAGSMLAASVASAALVDVVAVPRVDFTGEPNGAAVQAEFATGNYQVWDIMAVFDNANDELVGVLGTPDDPMTLNALDGATIFQGPGEPANQWHRPSPFANYANVTNAFDTYGILDTNEAPLLAGQADSGNTPYAGPFGDGLNMTDGGYVDSPGNGVGEAGADLMVRFAQITTQGGLRTGGSFFFTGLLNYTDASGQSINTAFEVGKIPTPGALALLGVAGIAARRRRRA